MKKTNTKKTAISPKIKKNKVPKGEIIKTPKINKKEKSSTSKKNKIKDSVKKVKIENPKKQGKKLPSEKKQKAITTPEKVAKQKTKKIDSIKKVDVKEEKTNYQSGVFTIQSETTGFIKNEDGFYGIRLNKGVEIEVVDNISYKMRYDGDSGSKIESVFECVTENEFNNLLSELIEYTKTGEVTWSKKQKSKIKNVNLDNVLENVENPVKSENTNTESTTKLDENAITTTQVAENPDLINIKSYGNTILQSVHDTFQVKAHGSMPVNIFEGILKSCASEYHYSLKNDGYGYYLNMSKNELTIRIPENQSEFLPLS